MITPSGTVHANRPSRYGADQPHPPNSHQGWTEERGPVKPTVVVHESSSVSKGV